MKIFAAGWIFHWLKKNHGKAKEKWTKMSSHGEHFFIVEIWVKFKFFRGFIEVCLIDTIFTVRAFQAFHKAFVYH